MRYAIHIPNFGPFGDARVMARLAAEAEAAGWDGVFIWDHVVRHEGDFNLVDPWVALTAIALATNTVAIGPLVTPLPRRRPWNVAKAAANLDHVSGGRIVLGVGIGGSERGKEFGAFGEEDDPRRRGDMLDEGIELLREVWSGQPIQHAGEHYHVESTPLLPRPLQSGGIPLWAATQSVRGRPVRRAAGLDGIFPIGIEPDEIPALVEALAAAGRRLPSPSLEGDDDPALGDVRPFDIVVDGTDDAGRWEGTAVTWWLRILPWDEPLETSRRIVGAGPRR
jgi:alkanesulfonate monooxygenase SsuD/methylene tetrahydromethanopterin reductase-like flavin-dependent oxidoreductase (luciferase family)